jgi:hypothetical protein
MGSMPIGTELFERIRPSISDARAAKHALITKVDLV